MPSFDARGAIGEIARNDYLDFLDDYGDFEGDLFGSLDLGETDPGSLVDQARTASVEDAQLAEAVAGRQRSRYGIAAPTQDLGLAGSLAQADAVNRARDSQRVLDDRLAGQLSQLGGAVNRASFQGLGQLAGIQQAEANASRQRKAANRSRNIGAATTALTLAASLI